MELRIYLRILLKHWWIVLPVFLVTLAGTTYLTLRQPSRYRSTASYVVTPSEAFQGAKDFAAGLDTLSRRVEIAATYGEVASSRTVRLATLDKLNLPEEKTRNMVIEGQLLAGTNIFKITVEALDPVVARDVANAIGTETIEYVRTLYEPYILRLLDSATVRRKITGPSRLTTIFLGGVFGLFLGAGLAFLADYLRTPMETMISVSVLDPEIGVYSKDFFRQRLAVEMARAKRQRYSLSVALINVDQLGMIRGARSPQAQSEILRKAAVMLTQSLREEDLVAYLGQATFAVMLPDVKEQTAQTIMERLRTRMSWSPVELERSGVTVNLTGVTGIAPYELTEIEPDELIDKASQAMRRASMADYGQRYPAADGSIVSAEQPAES